MGETSTAPAKAQANVTKPPPLAPDLRRWAETREKSAPYWIGVIPFKEGDPNSARPPMHTIDAIGGAGVSFHEWYTPHEGKGQDGGERRGQYLGHVVELTARQVAALRAGFASTLVRWRAREGRHAHGYLVRLPPTEAEMEDVRKRFGLNEREVARLRIKADGFRVFPTDEPVSRYVYAVRLPAEYKAGTLRRPSNEPPRPVIETGIEDPA